MTVEAKVARPALDWRFVVREPLALALAQPHQALISCASVALMAQFAASGGIVAPAVGYALAVGVEWAFLRGLVSDSKAPTAWGGRLNWSAFAVVLLWGTLWCVKAFGALPERPVGGWAVAMALAHVLPIAWLSLCSGMSHRAMVQAEAAAAKADDDARKALQLEMERKDAELERWKESMRFKAELAATPANQKPRVAQPFVPGSLGCKHCGRAVEFATPSEKGVLVRLGCPACRAERKGKREG